MVRAVDSGEKLQQKAGFVGAAAAEIPKSLARVDGAEVMNVVDRGFRDPLDGVALVNSGGDYALRSITIDGVD